MDNQTREKLKQFVEDLRAGRVPTFSDKTKELDIALHIEERFQLLDSDECVVRCYNSVKKAYETIKVGNLP